MHYAAEHRYNMLSFWFNMKLSLKGAGYDDGEVLVEDSPGTAMIFRGLIAIIRTINFDLKMREQVKLYL